jgi:amino acid transporter
MAYPHVLAKTPNLLKSVLYFYFIFSGFDDIMKFVQESKDPDQDVPRAFHLSNAVTALLVVGVAYAYLHVLTFKKDSHYHGDNAIALIVESAFGVRAGKAVYWAGMFLMIATGLVSFLAVTRYMYALAETVDGKEAKEAKEAEPSLLRRALIWLQDLNAAKAPWRSILVSFGLAALMILINHVDLLISLSDLSLSAIMVLVSAAVSKRRWRETGSFPWIEGATTAGFAGLLGATFFG